MEKWNRCRILLLGLLIFILVAFNVYIGIVVREMAVLLISIGVSAAAILLFYLYAVLFDHYLSGLIEKLSEMIAAITELREQEVFSMTEDTMLSKLQFQIIKLVKILKNQSQQSQNEKDNIKALISDIAHQLKTPLANMKIYSGLLKEEELPEEERSLYLQVLFEAVDKLSFLTEGLIQMSRLEGGIIVLHKQKQDLYETILQAVKQVHLKAQENGVRIRLGKMDKLEVDHDRNWITEAVYNLLDNGVKYGRKHGTVEIELIPYELFVCILVKDNGNGIPKEEHEKIFKRFYRGSDKSEQEGFGLGLYLTRKIATLHGGYIKVKSDEKGSEFALFIPFQ